MKDRDKRLVSESIKHWERMIGWVKKQLPNLPVCFSDMQLSIGEWWGEKDCPLCQEYFSCIECPLCLKKVSCNDFTSSWKKVNNAKTWGGWLEASDGMIKSLKEIEAD